MMMTVCLQVWHVILSRNRGLHFSFILGHLPLLQAPIYVDASLTGGIGGYCGRRYFSWSIEQLKPWLLTCEGWESFPNINIAWLELFADCAALYMFAPCFTHQRQLTLFLMICHLPDDPLHAHAEHVLLHSDICSKSWFIQVRNICAQYDLPHPLTLLQSPPAKQRMRKLLKLKITEYWQAVLTT